MLVFTYYILKLQFVPILKRRALLQSPDGASSLPDGAKKVGIKKRALLQSPDGASSLPNGAKRGWKVRRFNFLRKIGRAMLAPTAFGYNNQTDIDKQRASNVRPCGIIRKAT